MSKLAMQVKFFEVRIGVRHTDRMPDFLAREDSPVAVVKATAAASVIEADEGVLGLVRVFGIERRPEKPPEALIVPAQGTDMGFSRTSTHRPGEPEQPPKT
jgi:hypothetical protein